MSGMWAPVAPGSTRQPKRSAFVEQRVEIAFIESHAALKQADHRLSLFAMARPVLADPAARPAPRIGAERLLERTDFGAETDRRRPELRPAARLQPRIEHPILFLEVMGDDSAELAPEMQERQRIGGTALQIGVQAIEQRADLPMLVAKRFHAVHRQLPLPGPAAAASAAP